MARNWQDLTWKLGMMISFFSGGVFTSFGNNALAQITPDRTLRTEGSVVKPLSPNVDRIDGGAIRGTNLFHSFQDFNVGEGRGAYFANPIGVENIFSRVTGGNPSKIYGTLGVLGNANLYLLNTSGIIFGPNARLDIRGSFVGSTADSIVFSDRTLFRATDTQAKPPLTVAVPVGLQYGAQQAGAISNAGNLAVGQGQKLALVGGTVTSSGQLTSPGGTVQVLGDRVGLLDNARIDVSGETGGGTVLIGGDFQGKGEVPNAARTFVGPGVTINANALSSGNGGRVIVWANEATGFSGNISARGGRNSGNGGFVEVSGKEALQFAGFVDTRAPFGLTGTLLLDPKNILVQAGGSNSATGQAFEFNSTATSTISGANLSASLNTTGVTLQANNDITINDEVTGVTSGNGLTLQAGRSVIFNQNRVVSLTNGNFSARINDERAASANRDSGTAQFMMNTGSQILTHNGNVTIEHGKFGGSAVGEVRLNGATINSGTGNISITGTGKNGGDSNYGILLDNKSVVSSIGNGTITLNGTSGDGRDGNIGVLLNSEDTVSSTDGIIRFTGIGYGSGVENYGIQINYKSVVQSTGTGNIILKGTNNSKGNRSGGSALEDTHCLINR